MVTVVWNVTGFVENAVHRQIGNGHAGVIDGNEHEVIHGSAPFGELVFVIVEAFVFPRYNLVVKVMSEVGGWCLAIENQQE
jgi:hypothetical protein